MECEPTLVNLDNHKLIYSQRQVSRMGMFESDFFILEHLIDMHRDKSLVDEQDLVSRIASLPVGVKIHESFSR